MKTNSPLTLTVTEEMAGTRIDKALGALNEIGSRSRAEHLVKNGRVSHNGKILQKTSEKLKVGDVLTIELEITHDPAEGLKPYDIDLEILFEDSDIIVLNKPAGLVVHPAAGHQHDTLVNALVGKFKDFSMKFGDPRPGIVHRLDKETSGILVIAKNDFAHEKLAKQFKDRTVHRIYHALAFSIPPKSSGSIESTIARNPVHRKKFASMRTTHPDQMIFTTPVVVEEDEVEFFEETLEVNFVAQGDDDDVTDEIEEVSDANKVYVPTPKPRKPPSALTTGKWAKTNYKVLQRLGTDLSYLELKLETGRTHQIRVHMSEAGCPLVKDVLYGAAKKEAKLRNQTYRQIVSRIPRICLHALELGFDHPRSGERMHFKQPWPADVKPMLVELGVTSLL